MTAKSLVRVGDGRGFVIQAGYDRLIITAAHCLKGLPPAHPAAGINERTARLLGALADPETSVFAECLFVDPVADIAVLGSPDGQVLFEEAEGYEALVEGATPLTVASTTSRQQSARLVALDLHLFRCTVSHNRFFCGFTEKDEFIDGGMSGSPIIDDDDRAIGIVSTSCVGARLAGALPGWLLAKLGVSPSAELPVTF